MVTLLDRTLGRVATAAIEVEFESSGGHLLCRPDAPPAAHPLFVDWEGKQLFLVRMGNSTRQFGIADAMDYIRRPLRS